MSSKLIVLTADRIITSNSGYHPGNKVFSVKGIGCVATWGDRTGFHQFQRLMIAAESKVRTIDELANFLWDWLRCDMRSLFLSTH
jgi:hypothetical protein